MKTRLTALFLLAAAIASASESDRGAVARYLAAARAAWHYVIRDRRSIMFPLIDARQTITDADRAALLARTVRK